MRSTVFTGSILIAAALTLMLVLLCANTRADVDQSRADNLLITPTALPPVDPTPIGGIISPGMPLPTPLPAAWAIAPSNVDRLVETRQLGKPINVGVSDIAFTRDGNRLVSSWGDLVVWKMPEGVWLYSIPLTTTSWTPFAISPDGRLAALGNYENLGWVELWNLTTRQRARQHRGGQQIRALGFNLTGTLLAAGRNDGSVTVWDTETGSLLHELQKDWSGCTGMAFHPQRNEIAASSANNTVRIWNALTGQQENELSVTDPPAACALSSLAYRPDGAMLAAAMFWEKRIAFWQDGAFIGYLTHPDGGTIWKIAWSPDGKLLAAAENAGSQGAQIVLWDVENRRVARILDQWRGEVTFSPDGALLVTEGFEGQGVTVRILSIVPHLPYAFFLPLVLKAGP